MTTLWSPLNTILTDQQAKKGVTLLGGVIDPNYQEELWLAAQ